MCKPVRRSGQTESGQNKITHPDPSSPLNSSKLLFACQTRPQHQTSGLLCLVGCVPEPQSLNEPLRHFLLVWLVFSARATPEVTPHPQAIRNFPSDSKKFPIYKGGARKVGNISQFWGQQEISHLISSLWVCVGKNRKFSN